MLFDDTGRLFGGIIELISEWNPKKHSTEKDYQKDLYDFLKQMQEGGEIKEDRLIARERGRNRADIVINDVIGIEIKKDLRHQPSVDRAVAQVKRMKNEYNYVIILIVGGNNSTQHIDLLKHEIREFLQGDSIMGNEKSIKVIQIKSGKKRPKREDGFFGNFGNPFG